MTRDNDTAAPASSGNEPTAPAAQESLAFPRKAMGSAAMTGIFAAATELLTLKKNPNLIGESKAA
jgi:hypothetical protein